MAISPSDRNYLIVVSVVIVLIIMVGSGVIYILAQRQHNRVAEETSTEGIKSPSTEVPTPTAASTPKTIATLSPTTFPSSSPTTSPSVSATISPTASPLAPKTVEVSILSSGFSPGNITINQNDTVCFVNKDDVTHWPASAEHPTHTVYPEFDPKKAVQPGDSYCFTFGRIGTWKYHDHLEPAVVGTVIVNAR